MSQQLVTPSLGVHLPCLRYVSNPVTLLVSWIIVSMPVPLRALQAVPFGFKYFRGQVQCLACSSRSSTTPRRVDGRVNGDGQGGSPSCPLATTVHGFFWMSCLWPNTAFRIFSSDTFFSVLCFSAAGNRQLFGETPRIKPRHSFSLVTSKMFVFVPILQATQSRRWHIWASDHHWICRLMALQTNVQPTVACNRE